MKINKLRLVNFMGINGEKEYEFPKISALCGENGKGKTTVIKGLQYALSGLKPTGEIINTFCDGCSVSVEITDSKGEVHTFTREEYREKPSVFRVDDKKTTQKMLHEALEATIGIPVDRIKTLSSSDILSALKPQEMAALMLEYIPEKLKLEKVLSFIPEASMGVMDIITANLPETNIEMSAIEGFYDLCVATRKELKKALAGKESIYEQYPHHAPAFSEKELRERLDELNSIEAKYKVYEANLKAYERSLEEVKRHENLIASLDEKIKSIKVTRPDESIKNGLIAKMESLNTSKDNLTKTISGSTFALDQLRSTLKALDSSICPVSNLICCHEDKSVAKSEIAESIKATEDGLNAAETELKKVIDEIAKVEEQKNEFNTAVTLYIQKCDLLKQKKELEENKPTALAKPDEVTLPESVLDEIAEIKEKLLVIDKYKEGVTLSRQIENLKIQAADYDFICKAFADKGAVKNGVLNAYIGVFEETCNNISATHRPECDFKFLIDDGVVILMNNGKGSYLPYASLSGGEKAYMLFVIMSMLNALCGTKLLLLDELTVMDDLVLDKLLSIIVTHKEDFDHVILTAVNHTEVVKSINNHEIPMI